MDGRVASAPGNDGARAPPLAKSAPLPNLGTLPFRHFLFFFSSCGFFMSFDPIAPAGTNPVVDHIAHLKQLFPEAFTEDKIDFDVLRQLLGGHIDEREEKYGLNWHGKRRARQLALTPSEGTLLPCPEDSVDWDTTQNVMIEGDNLEVLKLLQKTYAGKVKLIYIDPPYNTGKDFVYPDDFRDGIRNYLELTGQVEDGKKISSNTDTSGRFHTDWLNMMYPRLKLARSLLREDGVVFISIGESELANLLEICRQVFGEENSIGIACRVAKKSNNKGDHWAPNFDYIISCAKSKEFTVPFLGGVNTIAYDQIEESGPRQGEAYQLVRLYMSTIENQNPDQRYWIDCPDGSKVIPPGTTFPPERPKLGDGIWRWTKRKFDEEKDRIVVKEVRSSNLLSDTGQPAKWNVFTKTYLKDVIENATSKPNNLIEDFINQLGSHEMTDLAIPFDYPKPTGLLKYLCEITRTGERDLVLDFFAGSGTTSDAVMQINADGLRRRCILVQLPEILSNEVPSQKTAAEFCDSLGKPRTIAEITKERLRRAGAKIKAENPLFTGDVGFRVFKLASSNIRAWNPAPEALETTLLEQVEHLLPGRNEEDVLFELLLKVGHDLCAPVAQREINVHKVYAVDSGKLIACFSSPLTLDHVAPLAQGMIAWHKELQGPDDAMIVFRDSAFVDDVVKTNMAETLKQAGLKNLRSL